jgi:exopolysaccharide biosynthesis polyprenyl glycosylphosphotransferase
MREIPSSLPDRGNRLNRAGDVVLLALASFVAALQAGGFRWQIAVALIATGTALWLIAGRALHQYDPGNGRGFFDDVALTMVMVAAVTVPIAALSIAVPRFMSAAQTAHFLLFLLPTVLLLRVRGVGLRLWHSSPTIDVLIAGVGPLGRLTGNELSEDDPTRNVLGYLAFGSELPHDRLRAPFLGSVETLETTLRERVVGEVYFASTGSEHSAQMQAGIRTCEKLGVPFALPICAYRLTRGKITSPPSDGYLHFLTVEVKPVQRAVKRVFDILASGVALVVLSPLLLTAAIAIRLTSKGPILFRQERVGLHGRKFHMLKFRSMVANAEELKARLLMQNEQSGPVFKMTRDPRVTSVGRFIRKYSIDELPQLVNILRGDMSVVGPRPPLGSEVAKYEGWQYRRLSVRPGLTCVWQVSGRNNISFDDWMLLDMRYIDHWSLLGDFGLIWQTIPVVVLGRGAS